MVSIKTEGLQCFISELGTLAQSLVSVPRAMALMRGLGLECDLACKLEVWTQHLTVLPPGTWDLRSVEARLETPIRTEEVKLTPQPISPDVWKLHGSFQWPMDRFGLSIKYGDRQGLVTVFGPLTGILGDAWLADEKVPAVAVSHPACAVVRLLTGREVGAGNFTGTAGIASYQSGECVRILSEYVHNSSSPS